MDNLESIMLFYYQTSPQDPELLETDFIRDSGTSSHQASDIIRSEWNDLHSKALDQV